MTRWLKWMLPLVAVGGLWLVKPVLAEAPAPATTGIIKGSVVDKDGKPVADAKVSVESLVQQEHPKKHQAADGDHKKKERGKHYKEVAKAVSDANGDFTFTVEPGEYRVWARKQGVGSGQAETTVVASETVTVKVTVEKRK